MRYVSVSSAFFFSALFVFTHKYDAERHLFFILSILLVFFILCLSFFFFFQRCFKTLVRLSLKGEKKLCTSMLIRRKEKRVKRKGDTTLMRADK